MGILKSWMLKQEISKSSTQNWKFQRKLKDIQLLNLLWLMMANILLAVIKIDKYVFLKKFLLKMILTEPLNGKWAENNFLMKLKYLRLHSELGLTNKETKCTDSSQ